LLLTGPNGTLEIGERCVFNYGVVLDCHERISIGKGCLFGSMVEVSDRALGEG
jgi:acetyltransferase-like isoleucine patch superfamily enzyme